jgi:glycosyltransferase involved in cell wall biosynthesis
LQITIDARRIRDFGIGTYIRNLLPALAAADPSIRYALVGFPGDREYFQNLPDTFRVHEYVRSDKHRLNHLAFPFFLRSLGSDVTHIPLNRIPLFMPRPYVVTIHDISNMHFQISTGLARHLSLYSFQRGLSRASRVIAVSEATRRDVVQQLRIPPERVHLVYNALDPAFLKPRPLASAAEETRRILERYQIHDPYLLYAGHIRPQKNIPRLVEAFAVVRNRLQADPVFRNLKLLVLGDLISKYPEVRRAVMQSRVEDRVRFLGFVPQDTLRVFYEHAEAFVFPSLYEGFGLAPLEAMSCGAPVITSNTSSLPEVVGDAAVLVNPENVFEIARGILEVLTNPVRRAELVAQGRERARFFSWAEAARQVIDIYRLAYDG